MFMSRTLLLVLLSCTAVCVAVSPPDDESYSYMYLYQSIFAWKPNYASGTDAQSNARMISLLEMINAKLDRLNSTVGIRLDYIDAQVFNVSATLDQIRGDMKLRQPITFYPAVFVFIQLFYMISRMGARACKYINDVHPAVGLVMWGIVPSPSYYLANFVYEYIKGGLSEKWAYEASIAIWVATACFSLWLNAWLDVKTELLHQRFMRCKRVEPVECNDNSTVAVVHQKRATQRKVLSLPPPDHTSSATVEEYIPVAKSLKRDDNIPDWRIPLSTRSHLLNP